jgi:hypothetical protein
VANIQPRANRFRAVAATTMLLVPIAFGAGAASATSAGSSDTQIATMTGGLSPEGDAQTWWYSENGTTGVVTNLNAAGQVESVEKIVYSVHHDRLVHTNTVVFPAEEAWATYT